MALGEHIVSGHSVLSHIRHMENTLVNRNLQKQINLSRYYTHGSGNVNIIFNHYLNKLPWDQDKKYLFQYAHPHRTTGQITQSLIESNLLTAAYKDAVILTTAHDNKRGHAVSLKRSLCTAPSSEGGYTWHILDSLKDHPVRLLTNNDWKSLQGSILAFQKKEYLGRPGPYLRPAPCRQLYPIRP
eukprot:1140835-Pelagomonas_calceolata.AAC.1